MLEMPLQTRKKCSGTLEGSGFAIGHPRFNNPRCAPGIITIVTYMYILPDHMSSVLHLYASSLAAPLFASMVNLFFSNPFDLSTPSQR